MDLSSLKYEIKVILENVGCLGNRDPKSSEYQDRMVDHIIVRMNEVIERHQQEVIKKPMSVRLVCYNGM